MSEKQEALSYELYNTQREKISLSQYGRNIQKLVEYLFTIKDREKRNKAAKEIIEAMEIINPKIKLVDNYKCILWNHLAMISDYKLDVDYPCEIIQEEEIKSPPDNIPVLKTRIKKRAYGRIIDNLIEKAKKITDKELQKELIEVILLQMKRTYIEWNKDVVNDEVIFQHFKEMSGGELPIPEGLKLPQSYEIRSKLRNNNQIPHQNYNRRYRKRQNVNR